jgi:hypothetical protein
LLADVAHPGVKPHEAAHFRFLVWVVPDLLRWHARSVLARNVGQIIILAIGYRQQLPLHDLIFAFACNGRSLSAPAIPAQPSKNAPTNLNADVWARQLFSAILTSIGLTATPI